MRRIEEGGTLTTMDKKTIQAIEEGVAGWCGVVAISCIVIIGTNQETSSSNSNASCPSPLPFKLNKNYMMKKRYPAALKEATEICVPGGGSLRKIACEMNEKYKHKGKWKLTHETLHKYTDLKHPEQVNLSPLRQGPKPSLPLVFLDLLQVHVSMCQLSGNGECKLKN